MSDRTLWTHRKPLLGGLVVALVAAGVTSFAGSSPATAAAAPAPQAQAPAASPVGVLTAVGLPAEIEVLTYSWGVSNSGTTHAGGGAGAGKANVQDISLTKAADATSVELLRAVTTGRHLDTATLTLCDVRDCAATTTATYKFNDVLVTALSLGSAAQSQTEQVALNFRQFTVTRGTSSFSYDMAQSSTS